VVAVNENGEHVEIVTTGIDEERRPSRKAARFGGKAGRVTLGLGIGTILSLASAVYAVVTGDLYGLLGVAIGLGSVFYAFASQD
jgi:hypothetical protein